MNPSQPKQTLGELLREYRRAAGWTLRYVEAQTGISNGYLSLLESDKVKSPSPLYLSRLAETYRVPYAELMNAAGYGAPASQSPAHGHGAGGTPTDLSYAALSAPVSGVVYPEDLTPAEFAQVRAFIQGLKGARSYGVNGQPTSDGD